MVAGVPPLLYGVMQEDTRRCHLISENYAYALQLILGFAALAGLVLKRWRAPVKRDLVVWMYDVSKQGFGAMFIHVWNIVLSIQEGGGVTGSDECAMYFVNFSLDIAIGTFVIWCFVRVQELTARRFDITSLKITGDYGTPPLFSVYRTQLLTYMAILVICKAVTTAIVISMDDVLSALAKALFSPVSEYPELELTIVMIICPWILNALQFWILDNVLMSEKAIPEIRGGDIAKYEHMSDLAAAAPSSYGDSSGMGDSAGSLRDNAGAGDLDRNDDHQASEMDVLNTPPQRPDEPLWMTEPSSGGSAGGDGGTGGGILGWRGGRRNADGERNTSRGRSMV